LEEDRLKNLSPQIVNNELTSGVHKIAKIKGYYNFKQLTYVRRQMAVAPINKTPKIDMGFS
jgi:hypothetical protein